MNPVKRSFSLVCISISFDLKHWRGVTNIVPARLLQAMASIGLLADVGDRTWQATPIAQNLTSAGVAAGFRVA